MKKIHVLLSFVLFTVLVWSSCSLDPITVAENSSEEEEAVPASPAKQVSAVPTSSEQGTTPLGKTVLESKETGEKPNLDEQESKLIKNESLLDPVVAKSGDASKSDTAIPENTDLESLTTLFPRPSTQREFSFPSELVETSSTSTLDESRKKTATDHSDDGTEPISKQLENGVHELALRSKDPTEKLMHPDQETILKGEEGTVVKIPPHSLAFEDGTPCNLPATVKMWEFYQLPDILLAGLSTDCDEGLLQTGGMIYLEAEADGRPLVVAENKRIQVKFEPSRPINSEFDLFHGVKEKGRISWRRAKNAKEGQGVSDMGSVVRLTMHEVSDGEARATNLSDAEFVKTFFNFVYETPGGTPTEIITDFSRPRSYVGLGTALFSNGAKVFFDGALQIRNFHSIGKSTYKRFDEKGLEENPSSIMLDYQGGFLAAMIPPQHRQSSFSLTLEDDKAINPIIRTLPSRDGSFFLVDEHLSPIGSLLPELRKVKYVSWDQRIGDNHAVRCIEGKVHAYSRKHFLRLNASEGRRFGILSPAESSSIGNLHGQGPRGENFATGILEAMSAKIDKLIRNADTVKVRTPNLNQVDMRRVLQPNQNSRILEKLKQQNEAQRPKLEKALEELRGTTELCDAMLSVAGQVNDPDTLNRCTILRQRLSDSINKLENQLGQESLPAETLIAKMEAASEFSSEFLSPKLGWHNLDRLRHKRKGMESFDLASDFSFDSSSEETFEEETKIDTSFGPFFYAVWPSEGISSNAFKGTNKVPVGNFKAMGFAVDRNGQIFAAFEDARTGKDVELDLEAMDREEFRRIVANWK